MPERPEGPRSTSRKRFQRSPNPAARQRAASGEDGKPRKEGGLKDHSQRKSGQERPQRKGGPERPQGKSGHEAGKRHPTEKFSKNFSKKFAEEFPGGDAGPARIAKLLARAGVASRRGVEHLLSEGRIALHGEVIESPATLLSSLEGVTVDGKPVPEVETSRVFLFFKPSGFLTTAHDPAGRPTIYDILPDGLPRLMPVGRLDYNTEGLLLLTNDGGLKRQLELPASRISRTYRVRAFGRVEQRTLEALALGITVEGMRYGSIDASIERHRTADAANIWLRMTLMEGKNREVRKVCKAIGLTVSRLIRTVYGPFTLGELRPREIVEAATADVRLLKRHLQTKKA